MIDRYSAPVQLGTQYPVKKFVQHNFWKEPLPVGNMDIVRGIY